MRHRVYGKHLGRNKDERRNLFKRLVYSLLSHGTIQTSEVKAKAIKGLVDKVINSAKSKNFVQLQSFVSDKSLRERLISGIIPKLNMRTSGYTRVIRVGTRLGDQATMVRMSLIGAEELKPLGIESKSQGVKELTKKTAEKDVKKVSEKKGRVGRSVRVTKSTGRVASRSSKTK